MFKVAELLKATSGRLILGSAEMAVKGIAIDSRRIKRGEAFLAIKGDNFDGHAFIPAAIKKGASCIIAEKAVKAPGADAVIRVGDTLCALGSLARFNRERHAIPVIAVTGSNGKTTTKDMIAWVLAGNFKVLKNEGTKNNHIGLPLTLLKLDDSFDLVVLEIGTNHFGEVKYLSGIARANVGVITNIGPAHLEHFKDLGGVFREKYDLIRGLQSPAAAVLNADDPYLRKKLIHRDKGVFALGAGVKNKSDFSASSLRSRKGRYSFKVNRRLEFALNAPGYYNVYNSLMACAVARIFGMSYPDIAARLAAFKPAPGRLNLITVRGFRFIDDTYNANPSSLGQALGFLSEEKAAGRKIIVMADMLELGAASKDLHIRAIRAALEACAHLILVGRIMRSCQKEFGSPGRRITVCAGATEAREILFKQVKITPDDLILVKGSRRMRMEEVFKF